VYKNFNEFGISDKVIVSLSEMGFEEPTPIQKMAIPPVLQGKDIIGRAQTGTGKTAAFGIPLIEQRPEAKGRYPYAIVLAPTRELAVQVSGALNKMGARAGVVSLPIYGGQSIELQIRSLKRGAEIVVGTPGRVLDHIRRKTLVLKDIKTVVLDEADEMLSMGFIEDIEKILGGIPGERQTMLFSATLSPEIMKLATVHMRSPIRIEVAPSGTTAEKVSQEFFIVRKDEKIRLLEKVLSDRHGSAIVFMRTKHSASRVRRTVEHMGYTAAELHSNRTQGQRRAALEGFKAGKYRVLVATDIAARGIDVKGVELVINYDLPSDAQDYVHRIGRTARAGASGHAISFAMPDEKRDIRDIERLIKKIVPVSQTPQLPPARAVVHAPSPSPPRAVGRFSHTPRQGNRPPFRGQPQKSFRGRRHFSR